MSALVALRGADLVLPDRVLPAGSLLLDGATIAAIEADAASLPATARIVDLAGMTIAPGFIDVHVHGVEGHDVLDDGEAVRRVAERLPRYGVTSFCPTAVACDPATLTRLLDAVATLRDAAAGDRARVLPAHLESNFINPAYKGAQPGACLRVPLRRGREGAHASAPAAASDRVSAEAPSTTDRFAADDILSVIARHRPEVAIVTMAPELEGGLELVRTLAGAGHLVSIGHSGATFDEAMAAIEAGARHATHLFNRMSPMTHREPGVVGAVLESPRVVAELICDGFHVHPVVMRMAIRAKGLDGIVAITDGTAGSGLPVGARTRLGAQTIVVTERTAELEDGTLAGSVLTMDAAFRALIDKVGLSTVEAARLCATTPARQLGLADRGVLAPGACADLVVLDGRRRVTQTYVAGRRWRNPASEPHV